MVVVADARAKPEGDKFGRREDCRTRRENRKQKKRPGNFLQPLTMREIDFCARTVFLSSENL
jgi:hypothetical protein